MHQYTARDMVNDNVLACVSPLIYAMTRKNLVNQLDSALDGPEFWTAQRDGEDTEVFEHWLVTPGLAYNLRQEGETVVEFLGMSIWARTTCGQAVYMDSVIQRIAGAA